MTSSADVTTFAIVGVGATGARIARSLVREHPEARVLLLDEHAGRVEKLAAALGDSVEGFVVNERLTPLDVGVDVAILATRAGGQAVDAQHCLDYGCDVIATSDSLGATRDMLELDEVAKREDRRLIIGAGMMPGLSDLLAAQGRKRFNEIHEIHVSKFGTGGPDCARQHHAALKRLCFDWRDEGWQRRAGGSGRELAWFPEPVEAADCYRAALPDPLLLVRSHPDAQRVSARMAATRRDRLTMHLPMLRRPHPEGLLGAVRVELRGTIQGEQRDLVLGCAERPAVATAVVAATCAEYLAAHSGMIPAGAHGLAEVVDAGDFLQELRRRGLRPEVFVGADETSTTG